jgi:AcrR family transcriptional regulator
MKGSSTEQLGLRELKKQRTRRLITETAWRLFLERGFDAVTVAEIARKAEVAEKTVFNYFPKKEDLVYGGMESYEREMMRAVRERGDGESILAAFGRFSLQPRGLLASEGGSEKLKGALRVISESPSLLAREQQVFARYTDSLAEIIREETGTRASDIRAWVAANAMMGIHRTLVNLVRERAIAGVSSRRIRQEVKAQGKRALGDLEAGLGSLAIEGR